MNIDDKLSQELTMAGQELQYPRLRELVLATLAAIPVAGGPITSLLSGKAQQRTTQQNFTDDSQA